MNFAVPVDHRINWKKVKRETSTKTLLKNRKNLWNMKVMVVPIVIGAPSTVARGLALGLEDFEIRGWVETIQTTTLLKSARILRRVLEIWGDLLSLRIQRKIISQRWCKNSLGGLEKYWRSEQGSRLYRPQQC